MPLPYSPLSQWVPLQRKSSDWCCTIISVHAQRYPPADLMVYCELMFSFHLVSFSDVLRGSGLVSIPRSMLCFLYSLLKESSVPPKKTWFSVQALDHKKWVKMHVHHVNIQINNKHVWTYRVDILCLQARRLYDVLHKPFLKSKTKDSWHFLPRTCFWKELYEVVHHV